MAKQKKTKPNRLTREQWLQKSLDLLISGKHGKLRIDKITKDLNVTKGSFYWHFKSRSDFIQSLVEYWAVVFTENIGEEIARRTTGAEDRLLSLMLLITEKNLAKYSLAVMDWGQHEPVALKRIQEVMDYQMDFVRSLFREMGFTGDELEMRMQTMVFFHAMEGSRYSRLTKKERIRHIELRHRMLISRQ
ncbi:MAG: TetR/AcrR family transcriptional regulator [Anaerohalosphaeraceae bacterium]